MVKKYPLILNYKEAKNALLAMDIAYNGKLNISRKNTNLIILKNKLANIITAFNKSFLKVWNKMYIKITFKRVLVSLAILLFLVFCFI